MIRVNLFTNTTAKLHLERRIELPEKLRKVPVRKILENMFTLSPALVVGAVCVQTRFFSDPFQALSYSASEQSAETAYIQPVKDALRLDAVASPAPAQIRRVAQEWLDGSRTGSLKPLLPVSSEDSMASQIKSEIYGANGELIDHLTQLAHSEEEQGDMLTASRDLQLGLDVAEVIKNCDAYTLANLSRREAHLVRVAVGLAPKLSVNGRKELAEHLADISAKQEVVERLARVEKLNLDSNIQRMASNDVNAANPGTAMEVGLSKSDYDIVAPGDRANRVKSANANIEIGRAFAPERRFQELLQQELAKLAKMNGNPQA